MAAALTEQTATKTDPELLRQISAARKTEEPVVGVFRLRPEDSTKLTNSPERTKEIVKEVVERVAKATGSDPQRLNVLYNLGVIVVSAAAQFLIELLKQPEIISAVANQSSESGKIEPINKRRVSESEIDTPVSGTNARSSKAPTKRYANQSGAKRKLAKAAKKR